MMKNWNRVQWVHCGLTLLSALAGLASFFGWGFLRTAEKVHYQWHVRMLEETGADLKYSLQAGYQNTVEYLFKAGQIGALIAAGVFFVITIWMMKLFKSLRSRTP